MIYLDHAATTPVLPAVIETIAAQMAVTFGNPSALYDLGLAASQVLERSRETVAAALGCTAKEVVFTGSGTEADNIAVLGAARARKQWGRSIVTTGYEHPAVAQAVAALAGEGFEIRTVAPDQNGSIDTAQLLHAVDSTTALVCCMAVNNETGARLDVAALARSVKAINKRTAVHCDFIQGFCKESLILDGAIDTAALSGHKLGAPKGIGALYVRRGFHIVPIVYGGGQEAGLRSGTENVAFAAGLATAVTESGGGRTHTAYVTALNTALRGRLNKIDGVRINSPDDASSYILNFSMPGYRSEPLLHFLEERGIYVSNGSACGKGKPSATLTAMGLPPASIASAIRVSFSAQNTLDDVEALVEALAAARDRLVCTPDA